MKIAYLISAYTDPLQLSRLVRALHTDYSDFYIHIDRKVDITPFKHALEGLDVNFINPRIYVEWGGNSQVKVILAMLNAAVASGNKYLRYVSMTGTDYPIFSNDEIMTYFKNAGDKELICAQDTGANRPEIEMRYYTGDCPLGLVGICGKILRRVQHKFFSLKIAKRKNYLIHDRERLSIYSGSDYWAISQAAAEYVVSKSKRNMHILKWVKYSKIPSERFAQTILCNSEFSDKCIHTDKGCSFQENTPLHYVIYTDAIKVLTESDYEDIFSSGKIFIRKCRTGISDGLMDKIDKTRLSDTSGFGEENVK